MTERYYIVQVNGWLTPESDGNARRRPPHTTYSIIDGVTGREQARYRTEDRRRTGRWPHYVAPRESIRRAAFEKCEQLNREDAEWQN